jgi:hypothetical protein
MLNDFKGGLVEARARCAGQDVAVQDVRGFRMIVGRARGARNGPA